MFPSASVMLPEGHTDIQKTCTAWIGALSTVKQFSKHSERKVKTMAVKYYAGKWNDHDLVVISDDKEELRFDGQVIAENKAGLHMSVSLKGSIPTDPELTAVVHITERNCSCIIGKELETEYEKETKTFSAVYNGHRIEGNNKKLKGTLIIDGEEADKEGSGLRDYGILGSEPDESGKRIMAIFEASGLKVKCQMYAEAENVRMIPCEKQGGELIPVNSNGDDQFAAGLLLGMCIH